MDMTAKGKVYPWQRLKVLEEYVSKHQNDFKERFDIEDSIGWITFASDGIIVESRDGCGAGCCTFINKADFMDWLHTDRKED